MSDTTKGQMKNEYKDSLAAAAMAGDMEALSQCIGACLNGDYGFKQDFHEALKYAVMVEEMQGDASMTIGNIYVELNDLEHAYHAFKVALLRGHWEAAKELESICSQLEKYDEAREYSAMANQMNGNGAGINITPQNQEITKTSKKPAFVAAGILIGVLAIGIAASNNENKKQSSYTKNTTYTDEADLSEQETVQDNSSTSYDSATSSQTTNGSNYRNNNRYDSSHGYSSSYEDSDSSSNSVSEYLYGYDEDEEDEEDESEYIFPYSDQQYLTADDLSGMSAKQLNLAKNELYARHGRIFDRQDLQDYFESCDWYEGTYTRAEWDAKGDKYFFNDVEIANRNLLVKYEKNAG